MKTVYKILAPIVVLLLASFLREWAYIPDQTVPYMVFALSMGAILAYQSAQPKERKGMTDTPPNQPKKEKE